MNQGIFGFRKYENSSLSYTGIDKHAGEDIGGWDTVLRREEYEALYARQQASMTVPDFVDIIVPKEEPAPVAVKPKATTPVAATAPKTEPKQQGPDWATILAPVCVGCKVKHKAFGDGVVSWMDAAKKYIRVKFIIGGKSVEKQFVFPDAFISGFLKVNDR